MTVLIPTLLYDTGNIRNRPQEPCQYGQPSQHKKYMRDFRQSQRYSLVLYSSGTWCPRHWVNMTFRANVLVWSSKKVENVRCVYPTDTSTLEDKTTMLSQNIRRQSRNDAAPHLSTETSKGHSLYSKTGGN